MKASCQVCKFMHINISGQLECRRSPPQISIFPTGVNPETKQILMTNASAFPVVNNENWCGEFSQRLEIATNADTEKFAN